MIMVVCSCIGRYFRCSSKIYKLCHSHVGCSPGSHTNFKDDMHFNGFCSVSCSSLGMRTSKSKTARYKHVTWVPAVVLALLPCNLLTAPAGLTRVLFHFIFSFVI
eukprot:TRINITY_DN4032_c1_g1_i1.p1 TRINITY_DN4032_c1_g1~~TRINITY_DN4032_c1_g1_i1.p1  ORF type:complete len:105 (+),score=2.34 TRINITY_DN4032_c1_g1_i1:1021-1335(+)